jgi:hypothetical protein
MSNEGNDDVCIPCDGDAVRQVTRIQRGMGRWFAMANGSIHLQPVRVIPDLEAQDGPTERQFGLPRGGCSAKSPDSKNIFARGNIGRDGRSIEGGPEICGQVPHSGFLAELRRSPEGSIASSEDPESGSNSGYSGLPAEDGVRRIENRLERAEISPDDRSLLFATDEFRTAPFMVEDFR